MKFFICKTCGHVDLTSNWGAERPKDDAELICPKCKGKKYLKMELLITG